MLKKLLNVKLLVAVVILAVFAGAALAQSDAPQAPDAVRVRMVHLASFPGSNTAAMTVSIDGNPVPGSLTYGQSTSYITLTDTVDDNHTFIVLRDGAPFKTRVINLTDGDHTVAITGNLDELLPELVAHKDTTDPVDIGKAKLRVINVAGLGYTLADTSVDVCSQEGVSFTPTGNDLRYKEATIFKILNAGAYNLKMTDWIEGSLVFCTGPTVIDPVPLDLADRSITTLYLTGDNDNQEARAFSIELGFIENEDPVAQPATLTIIKQVVGAAPGADWQFNGTTPLGAFTLPAAGGNKVFTDLAAGSYQVTETAVGGYTTTVACTNGASGSNSVNVNLIEGANVTCTFINTEAGVTPPPPTAFCEEGKSCSAVPAVFGSPLD